MGLYSSSIDVSRVAYASSVQVAPVSTTFSAANRSAVSTTAALPSTPLFDQGPKTDSVTIGFGDGSVSTASAVLHTVKDTVQAARSVVESLAEVRARINQTSENAAAESKQTTPTVDTRGVQLVQRGQSQAAAAKGAQRFINALSETATAVQARLSGQTPPAPREVTAPQATFDVNGQTLTATLAPNAPRLDLLA